MSDPGRNRRAGTQRLLTGLIVLAAAAGLFQPLDRLTASSGGPPARAIAGPAVYRPDGGQALGGVGGAKVNALTQLSLGRKIRLSQTPPEHLAALPGFGDKSGRSAVKTGCLTSRQRRQLKGMIIETCDRTKP